MPLSRDHFNQIIEIFKPHVNVEDDRRPLLHLAFFGEPVVDQLTYSGNAVTFAVNCVNHLKTYNGELAIVQLLETLRDRYADEDKKKKINQLLAEMDGMATVTDGNAVVMPIRGGAPTSVGHLFISYSRNNNWFVTDLRTDLNKRGIPYWLDQEGLSPGTPNWERAIKEAIRVCSAVLWVVSPDSNESEYVYSELVIAEMYKRRVYPVWADGDNWVDCVPMGRHRIQYVDMRGDRYTRGLVQLLVALGQTDSVYIVPQGDTPAPSVDASASRNPYKGLEAFHEDDADDFFGRETLVATLVERLGVQLAENKARFLAVLGPSGAGKSSVVMAGLLPALKQRNAIPGSNQWRYLPTITPGEHPMEAVAGTIATLMPSADPATVLQWIYTMGSETLFDIQRTERVVLYIDQFEETFTLAKDDGERQQFISFVCDAVHKPNGKLIVLLSMRADFLDYPLNYPQLGELFDKYIALVQPMNIPELHDAIQKPCKVRKPNPSSCCVRRHSAHRKSRCRRTGHQHHRLISSSFRLPHGYPPRTSHVFWWVTMSVTSLRS